MTPSARRPPHRSTVASTLLIVALSSSAAHATPPDGAPPAGAAPPVGAEPPARESLATELFNSGRELLEAGRVEEACAKLAESARLDPRVGTLGNLADCEERLGHLARARALWQQTANLARSHGDERVAHAESQLARLDARVPRLRLVTRAARPAGLVVRVDGVEIGAATLGTPVPLEAGVHSVEASAPDRAPWRAEVRLPERGEIVELVVPELPMITRVQPAVVEPEATRATVLVETGLGPLGVVGLAAAGVGVIGLGAGTWFAGVAQSRADLSAELGCVDDRCPPRAAEVRASARDAGDAATALLLTGGALTVGGVVTWILAPERVESVPVARRGPRLAGGAWATPRGAAATLEGTW